MFIHSFWRSSGSSEPNPAAPSPAPAKPFATFPGERAWVIAILVVHLLFSIGFSLGPIFEGPDEIAHLKFVSYMLQRNSLPSPPYEQGTGGETHQAPLYYMINRLLLQYLPHADFAERVDAGSNPYHGHHLSSPGNFNRNARFHYRVEAFPYTMSEVTMALHVLRLTSVIFNMMACIGGYLIFKLLWPARPDLRLAALGLMALWPQSLFIAGTLNNDNLVIMTGSLCLLWMLRQSEYGPSLVRTLVLGFMLGASIIAKSSSMFMVLPFAAAVLLDRRTWRTLPLMAVVVIVVGGWWYIRNQFLYGEPTGYTLFYQFVPEAQIQPGTLTFSNWLLSLSSVREGAWARFGDGSVATSGLVENLFDILLLLSGVGLVRAGLSAYRSKPDLPTIRRAAVVGLYMLAWLAAVGYIASTSKLGITGRVVLPGLAATSAVMATGLLALTPERFRLRAALSLVTLLTAIAAVCLFGHFRLAYLPEPVPDNIAHPLSYRFEGNAEITGTTEDFIKVRPGDTVNVVVYWRALHPTNPELMTYLHSLESNMVRWDSYPAGGNLMSTNWLPGETWAERYFVTIPVDAQEQSIVSLIAGLYEPKADRVISAIDSGDTKVLPVVGRLAISGPVQPFDPDYVFGGVIGLAQPEITFATGEAEVCLRWLSITPVTTDYQAYVHILTTDSQIIATSDFAPKGEGYPTSAWSPGETITGCTVLETPTSDFKNWIVTVGLYDINSVVRLPVIDRAGTYLINDEVLIVP